MRILEELERAGGTDAPREHSARLRSLLERELERGEQELERTRSGYEEPLLLAITPVPGALVAPLPIPARLRADAQRAGARAWHVVTACVGALVLAADLPAPSAPRDLRLRAGSLRGFLCLGVPVPDDETERAQLAALDLAERLAGVDRLRVRTATLPGHVVDDLEDERPPVGPVHPLRAAEAVARLGGDPTSSRAADALEEAVLAVLRPPEESVGAHADPDPDRRIARRILRRLDGMGKWGGYHTEFVHLGRGFAEADRRRAHEIGELLLAAGLLLEKRSVGQRHVWLNPRHSGEIRAFIEEGTLPSDLDLGAR